MRTVFYNTGYFIKEVATIFRMNLLSSIFSFLSTGLIFFILTMVISSWWISSRVVKTIEGEAEISIYYSESIDSSNAPLLVDDIKGISGVHEARIVTKEEAYGRMETILGKDAQILELFDDNPFSPFIDVKIDLDKMDSIMESLNQVTGIEYIRDNREVLNRLRNISDALSLLGYLVLAAVGISTLVILSHIIRLGIHSSKDQINTLRLLGAPPAFIALPFLLEGLILTLGGSILAVALSIFILKYAYSQAAGPLPFIPLPPFDGLVLPLIITVISLGVLLGIVGSLFGLSSARNT